MICDWTAQSCSPITISFIFNNMRTLKNQAEYSKITEYIYVGNNFCCQKYFSPRLLKEGVEADISLEEKQVDTPFGLKYYLWLPVEDHQAPTQEQLKIGADVLADLVQMKKKVYVHCEKGHGRAPTLVAAYLISQGMGVQEAIKFLKSKRPAVHLQDAQIEALDKFKRSLDVEK